MKKTLTMIGTVTASLLLSAIALSAADSCPVSSSEFDNLVRSNMKDQCLVMAKNCINSDETVQGRVDELRREIAKGGSVYSANELRKLNMQLNWIESESGNRFI